MSGYVMAPARLADPTASLSTEISRGELFGTLRRQPLRFTLSPLDLFVLRGHPCSSWKIPLSLCNSRIKLFQVCFFSGISGT
jgi:hypothetical protein